MGSEADQLLAELALREGIITPAQREDPREAWRDDPAVLARLRAAVAVAGSVVPETVVRGGSPRSPRPELPSGQKYEVRGELGHGGLGKVLRVWDRDIGREVAMKVMRAGLPPEFHERFMMEARLTGRLEHPNIIPVHDAGTASDAFAVEGAYYTMKRVQGRDLGGILGGIVRGDGAIQSLFPLRRLLRHFIDVCHGIAFAHSKGILHRDLKPANVMIGEFGETLIVDWGLAKDLRQGAAGDGGSKGAGGGGGSGLTIDGDVIGTPAYMSPEQAAGRHRDMDERSDVFSLGAILYEILALRPPFTGDSLDDIISRARSGIVTPPSRLTAPRSLPAPEALRDVPPELEAICMKSLSAEPASRHGSAAELAREVEAFIDGDLERERAAAEAARFVAEGREHAQRCTALRRELVETKRRLRELAITVGTNPTPESSRQIHGAQDAIESMEERQIEAYSRAHAAFSTALAASPGDPAARDGRAGLFHEEFLEAEAARDRRRMMLNRRLLAEHDPGGAFLNRLDAPGSLSVTAFAWSCSCLRPSPDAAWSLSVDTSAAVTWKDGRPCPGLSPAPRNRAVPALSIDPRGAGFGHRADCPRAEVAGAHVHATPYLQRGRHLELGEPRFLGVTPLARATLPQGTWLCTLTPPPDGGPWHGPVRFPALVAREGHWTQEVPLLRPDEVPAGFAVVPGGPFIFGGEPLGGDVRETLVTRPLLAAVRPVTAGDYLEFLNDLASRGLLEEARARQPREGDTRSFSEEAGRFVPRADADSSGDPADPFGLLRFPANGVSWHDAVAFAAWRSNREKRVYRLLHEEEFEKAARGVDGRAYPWGDRYERERSNTNVSHGDRPRLRPIGSFPADVSPYGLIDVAGNCATWCWSAGEAPYSHWKIVKGGAATQSPAMAHIAYRRGEVPENATLTYGIRLCLPLESQV